MLGALVLALEAEDIFSVYFALIAALTVPHVGVVEKCYFDRNGRPRRTHVFWLFQARQPSSAASNEPTQLAYRHRTRGHRDRSAGHQVPGQGETKGKSQLRRPENHD